MAEHLVRDVVTAAGPEAIPVLDLDAWERTSPAVRQAAGQALDEALRSTGFLLVRGHGVDPLLTADLVAEARAFFAQPQDVKLRVHRVRGGDPGYYPPASSRLAQSLGASSPADLKESFAIAPLERGTDAYHQGPEADRWFPAKQWPDEPLRLGELFSRYFATMTELADRLLRVFAVSLRQPERFFEPFTARHTSTAAVLHYPPQHIPAQPGQLRAGAHSDYGTLTILHKPAPARGLQVRMPSGGWLDVTPPAGCLIVNIGDLLAEWTGGRWVSTLHRVVNPLAGLADRGEISVPYFHQPDYDAVVRPLDQPGSPTGVIAGRHLADKVDRMHAMTAQAGS